MKILLSSKNPSKTNSIVMVLKDLEIVDYEIINYEVDSGVSGRPMDFEIYEGIDNRNNVLKDIASKENKDYDFLISIEGGFEHAPYGEYFIITYCGIIDKKGNKYYGKSQGFPITKEMFKYIRAEKSLNNAIEKIVGNENNKQTLGITGYLSDGNLLREEMDAQAVLSAFAKIVYSKQFNALEKSIINK